MFILTGNKYKSETTRQEFVSSLKDFQSVFFILYILSISFMPF